MSISFIEKNLFTMKNILCHNLSDMSRQCISSYIYGTYAGIHRMGRTRVRYSVIFVASSEGQSNNVASSEALVIYAIQ